jgi:hypothetical protein
MDRQTEGHTERQVRKHVDKGQKRKERDEIINKENQAARNKFAERERERERQREREICSKRRK